MAWTDQVFLYCERGQSGALWAEPLNALSNAAFLLVSLVALGVWRRLPASGLSELALIGLTAGIGAGSALFHTFATRWAMAADVVPIGMFMLAYTAYALRRVLGLGWPGVLAGLAIFAGLMAAASAAPCPLSLRALTPGSRCLNGSISYVPAGLMLVAVAVVAARQGHRACGYLWAACAAFAVSLMARTFDLNLCAASMIWGQQRGTHAVWHVLNAVTLGLLLLAALRHGERYDGRCA